jgi:hypothetical protein
MSVNVNMIHLDVHVSSYMFICWNITTLSPCVYRQDYLLIWHILKSMCLQSCLSGLIYHPLMSTCVPWSLSVDMMLPEVHVSSFMSQWWCNTGTQWSRRLSSICKYNTLSQLSWMVVLEVTWSLLSCLSGDVTSFEVNVSAVNAIRWNDTPYNSCVCHQSVAIRKGWRYQSVFEGQTIQWQKNKNDKNTWLTNTTQKTKDWSTRITLKTGCFRKIISSCSARGIRCVILVTKICDDKERNSLWLRQMEHIRGHLWHRYPFYVMFMSSQLFLGMILLEIRVLKTKTGGRPDIPVRYPSWSP